ncbi:MAG TPA: DUF3147 family protein [Terriglobales bacterium]|nr:DUF3147 family protein [Terriglobales bacterium]
MAQVRIHADTIKQTKWYECVIRFGLGGTITVVAGLVAKKFGPAVGGLFLAFPAIFPASATLVEKHEQEKREQKGLHGAERGRDAAALDAAGAAMGSIGLLMFALFVWQMLPDHSTALILLAAGVIWFVSACCLWLLRERRHRIFGTRGHTHHPKELIGATEDRVIGSSGHRVK